MKLFCVVPYHMLQLLSSQKISDSVSVGGIPILEEIQTANVIWIFQKRVD